MANAGTYLLYAGGEEISVNVILLVYKFTGQKKIQGKKPIICCLLGIYEPKTLNN